LEKFGVDFFKEKDSLILLNKTLKDALLFLSLSLASLSLFIKVYVFKKLSLDIFPTILKYNWTT
tara:strand:+ start:638 stop:829 length:192 start_codon:yes stop_codon:yes gene_type:complete